MSTVLSYRSVAARPAGYASSSVSSGAACASSMLSGEQGMRLSGFGLHRFEAIERVNGLRTRDPRAMNIDTKPGTGG